MDGLMADKKDPASKDEYLIAVGTVTQNAALGDTVMATALGILLECPFKTASAIFFTIDSFMTKRSLLSRVAEASGDATDQQLILEIIQAAERMNSQRRAVAHTYIVTNNPDLSKPFAIHRPKSGKTIHATKGWLSDLQHESARACKDCIEAFRNFAKKHNKSVHPEFLPHTGKRS
jgi:hypothetical protein